MIWGPVYIYGSTIKQNNVPDGNALPSDRCPIHDLVLGQRFRVTMRGRPSPSGLAPAYLHLHMLQLDADLE